MKSVKPSLITVFMLVFLLLISTTALPASTCDEDFFGVAVSSLQSLDLSDLELQCEEGTVRFTYKPSNYNPDIQASGYVKSSWGKKSLRIVIYNDSKKPLDPNYLTDEVRFISNSDREYKPELETEITNYPEIINPEEAIDFNVNLPVEQDKVSYILVQVGISNRKIVLLKPVG